MIRNVTLEDTTAITEIYNYYIKNSVATLEEQTVSESYFKDEVVKVTQEFPWFVYEVEGNIIGFANASSWKTRSGYRKSAQLMVYLHPEKVSKGIGTLLYSAVIDVLKEKEIHTIMGGISLPNEASIKLHEKFGFVKVAHYKEIGFKFNKWVDVGYWQLTLK